MVYAGGLGLAVGGLTRRHQVQSIQHSMQHSVLCLFQVGLTVLGRPNDRGGRGPWRTGGTPIPTYAGGPAGTLVPNKRQLGQHAVLPLPCLLG